MSRALAVFALFMMGFAQSGHASVITYSAALSGAAEVAPDASTGSGSAAVTVDTVANTLRVQASFTGLTGTTIMSHIHCCTFSPGTGAAGVATVTPFFPGFPIGATAGSYDDTLDLTLASTYNPAFVTANGGSVSTSEAVLLAGLAADEAYFNIHTTTFPAGEIRGFLAATPVPEGGSLPLLAGAIVGLGLLQRRRAH